VRFFTDRRQFERTGQSALVRADAHAESLIKVCSSLHLVKRHRLALANLRKRNLGRDLGLGKLEAKEGRANSMTRSSETLATLVDPRKQSWRQFGNR